MKKVLVIFLLSLLFAGCSISLIHAYQKSYCDKCGVELKGGYVVLSSEINFQVIKGTWTVNASTPHIDKADLCSKCAEKYIDWYNSFCKWKEEDKPAPVIEYRYHGNFLNMDTETIPCDNK